MFSYPNRLLKHFLRFFSQHDQDECICVMFSHECDASLHSGGDGSRAEEDVDRVAKMGSSYLPGGFDGDDDDGDDHDDEETTNPDKGKLKNSC